MNWNGYVLVTAEDNKPAVYMFVPIDPLEGHGFVHCEGCGGEAHYWLKPVNPMEDCGITAQCKADVEWLYARRYTGEWQKDNHDPADFWMYPPAK